MNPITLKVAIIATAAAFLAGAASGGTAGWTVQGWRLGEKIAQLQGDLEHEKDQTAILATGLQACNRSVDAAAAAGKDTVELAGKLLAEAQKVHAGGLKTADRLEELLKQPPIKGDDCNKAWDDIEAARKARTP